MSDKNKVQEIIKIMDETAKLSNIKEVEFFNDELLLQKVTINLRKIGKLGTTISSSLRKDYEGDFIWVLFKVLQKWSVTKDDDQSWDLLKGYIHNGQKYESLQDHSDILKKIWIAEFVLRRKGSPAPDINKITKHDIESGKYSGVKILYTPMGNKR